MVIIEGVDFANERPSGAALVLAGKRFVVRYLSPNTANNPGKRVTVAEIAHYRAAGLDLAFVWETTTSRAQAGHAAGVADARAAEAARLALGIPKLPIYFAVDEDTTGASVADYFRGVGSVLGVGRTGVYAGIRPVKYLLDNKLVGYAWQTYAWSGGGWDGRAQLQQYHNGVKVAGESLDLCRAMKADFGQWAAPGKQPTTEDDMPLTKDDINTLLKTAVFPYDAPKVSLGTTWLSTSNTVTQILAAVAKMADPAAIAAAIVAKLPTSGLTQAQITAAVAAALDDITLTVSADDTPAGP